MDLYTQCPRCKTAYRITVPQLRQGRGEAHCRDCQASFNALDALAETPLNALAASQVASQSPPLLVKLDALAVPGPERKKSPTSRGDDFPAFSLVDEEPGDLAGWIYPEAAHKGRSSVLAGLVWGGGVLLLLGLLAVQLWQFGGPQLAHDEHFRPWLEAACRFLGCGLPDFRAPQRIQIVSHDLRAAPNDIDGYDFSLVMVNQALQPQSFPKIKLILAARNGSPAASRVFQPAEYLPEQSYGLMAVGMPQEVHLLLARPQQEISGFSFELL